MKDYYKILDISSTADNFAINAAYKRLSYQYELGFKSSSEFTEIEDAYDILIHRPSRISYDLALKVYQSPHTNNKSSHKFGYSTNGFVLRCNALKSSIEAQEQENQQEQPKLDKLRYNKLKKRAETFKATDPFIHKNYVDKIKAYSGNELIGICLNWHEYAIEYIDLIIIELHENRSYKLDAIYGLIKETPVNVSKEGKETVWNNWFAVLIWLLIFALGNAIHQH